MWIGKIKTLLFWKNFSKKFTVGLSILLLVFASLPGNSDLFSSKISKAIAQETELSSGVVDWGEDWNAPTDNFSNSGYYLDNQVIDWNSYSNEQQPQLYTEVRHFEPESVPMGPTLDSSVVDYQNFSPTLETSVVDFGPASSATLDSSVVSFYQPPQAVLDSSVVTFSEPVPPAQVVYLNNPPTVITPVYNPPVVVPPVVQAAPAPVMAGPYTSTYTDNSRFDYNYNSTVDSHDRWSSTSTTRINDNDTYTDRSIRGSFNDSHAYQNADIGSFNDSHDTQRSDSHNQDNDVTNNFGGGGGTTATRTTFTDSSPLTTFTQPVNRQVTTQNLSDCPSGYTRTVQNGVIYCTVATNGVVENTATKGAVDNQPKVIAASGAENISELPKTGLPLAGLVLGGLLPIGLRLRRFNSQSIGDEFTANSIWESRQKTLT